MADDLNALLQANRSSSVLQGIMNPAQVNPLAAMTSAAQTAGTIFDMRQKQATQAAGEAYQGAIDPQTGEFDPNKFRINLQAAGPVAAMAAGPALANTQSISSDQLNQMRAKAGWANTAAGSLTRLGPNITQADAIGTLHQGVTQGILTQPEFERQVAELATLGNDPAKLHAWASQHQFNAMSTQQQLEQTYGTNFRENTGSAIVGGTQQPAALGGGINTAGGSIQLGLTPGELSAQSSIRDPRRTLPDGSPNPDYQKPKLFTRQEQLEMNGFKIGPNGEVYPPGQAPPGQGGIPGTGRYSIPSAISGNTNQPPPAVPTPAATGVVTGNPAAPQAVPAPPGGAPGASTAPYTGPGMGGILAAPKPRASLQGGVPVAASTNALQPNVGQPAPPSPAVPGDVAAMMAGINQARGAPATGTVGAGPAAQSGFGTGVGSYGGSLPRTPPAAPTTSASPFDRPAVGPSPGEEEQAKTAGGKFDNEAAAGVQAQSQQAILGNMLADTKQFMAGPYAETLKTWRSRLAPLFNVDEKALAGADSFDKLAAQLASAQGSRSDANLSIATAANPHPGQSAAGVDFVLRQLQGNADYLQARQKLAEKWPSKSDYNGFLESTRQLDPRVFQYERLTDNQKQDYFKALEPKDRAAFKTAHGWAEQRGLVAPPGS